MADKLPMEFSPYVGPDSLRQTTRLLNKLYDLHTKRYCGHEDINGSKYEGTVENWGSELLLEARKILLDKPSLKNIFVENTLDFYFDIEYSGFTNTYDQENMLCALLKKDVLLSNREYKIKFVDVDIVHIPRSQSSSDPLVYSDEFIHTTTPPVLIMEKENGVIEEISLKLTDIDDGMTNYYFHIDIETLDMFDPSLYPDENNYFITLPLNDSMYGRACFWICVDLLKTLPPVNIYNNQIDDKSFLTIGTDGHDKSYLYPLLNFSSSDIGTNYIIKIIPDDAESFVENENALANYTTSVGEIHLLEYNDSPNINETPISDTVITYDHRYVKMTLYNDQSSTGYRWHFKTPKPGDYDYDGRTYRNICYAWTYLTSFNNNRSDVDKSISRVPMLEIHFDDDSYLHAYEGLCENAYSGIHVDVTADYSNNGVSKKNGTIHDLGDFDGLPTYFKTMNDDTIHRAHIEAYAIRDRLNKRNQYAIDKQTAGIIIDSAVPQNEIQMVNPDRPIVIHYDWDNQAERRYIYDQEDPNISKTNNLSEIAYIDENNFGNSKMSKYKAKQKFIYHGNRHFSLGMMGFDPELEVGRVYIISNDSSLYENNETSRIPKAQSTFARICDIPTDFAQLTNIKGVAPTVVIDPEYIRTEANFSLEDKKRIYNLENIDHILRSNRNIVPLCVWPSYMTPTKIDAETTFPRYINLNEVINISSEHVQFSITSIGSGYAAGDEFIMYIGGISIRGIIKTVNDGAVTEFKFLPDETDRPTIADHYIIRSNINDRVSSYDTSTTYGSGSGLRIGMTIDQSLWDATAMSVSSIIPKTVPGIMAFKLDTFGNIWVYEYDQESETFVESEQLTGQTVYLNVNDSGKNAENYKFSSVFLYNMLNPISYTLDPDTSEMPYIYNNSTIARINESDDRIYTDEDLSDYINFDNKNSQDTIFVFGDGYSSSYWKRLLSYSWGYMNNHTDCSPMEIEMYQDLNLSKYWNKTNKFKISDVEGSQPKLLLFDPTITTIDEYSQISKDIISITSSKPFLLSKLILLQDNDNDPVIYGPNAQGIVESVNGEMVLTRNTYIYDEFNESDISTRRATLSRLTRESLVDKLMLEFPESLPAKYEGTPYQYTKEMLIDFFMENLITLDRSSGNPEFKYTDGPESIYRRPLVRLFRAKDEVITDNRGYPVGEQPSGAFKEVSSEVFDSKVLVDSSDSTAKPWNVFRIDTTPGEDINLDGLRMYDELNNDITDSTLLIIDGSLYSATIVADEIRWIAISRNISTEEER